MYSLSFVLLSAYISLFQTFTILKDNSDSNPVTLYSAHSLSCAIRQFLQVSYVYTFVSMFNLSQVKGTRSGPTVPFLCNSQKGMWSNWQMCYLSPLLLPLTLDCWSKLGGAHCLSATQGYITIYLTALTGITATCSQCPTSFQLLQAILKPLWRGCQGLPLTGIDQGGIWGYCSHPWNPQTPKSHD